MAESQCHLFQKILISVALGLSVFTISSVVGWYQNRDKIGNEYYRVSVTKHALKRLDLAIQDWREKHGKSPESIEECLSSSGESEATGSEETQVLDGWDNPIQYKIYKNGYVIISYGTSGNSYGRNFTNFTQFPPDGMCLSFWVFYSGERARGMTMSAILAGIFTFCCSCFVLREGASPSPKSKRVDLLTKIVGLAFIVAASIFIALSLGAFYLLPEYH